MKLIRYLLLNLILIMPLATIAMDALVVEIAIENHKFEPAEIKVPKNTKLKLVVHNKDATIEEFESLDFNREKIVPPGKKIHIILPPLKVGRYNFYGEFHQDTAKGVLVVE